MNSQTYGFAGNGRLAKHLQYYFSLLNIPYVSWNRGSGVSASETLKDADVILLCIPDDALNDFTAAFLDSGNYGNINKILIHFSGVVSIEGVYACHPLMSFGSDLYSLEEYDQIPFVCSEGCNFSALFPLLKNRWFTLNDEQRLMYHMSLSVSGNFTVLLWQFARTIFKDNLNLDPDLLLPYLNRITANLNKNPDTALTGPLVRGDGNTINKHLKILDGSPWLDVYNAFIKTYNSTVNNYINSSLGDKNEIS